MHWIAVHEEVLGSKLRGFRKAVKCSEAEALGILTVLWLWARKNADSTGLLGNTDKDDVANAIKVYISSKLDANKVTDELINNGWLDEIDGQLFVHDWYEWQQYWYNHLEKKEKDKARKRAERERRKTEQEQTPPSPPEVLPEASKPPNEEKAKSTKAKDKPVKKKYADKVKMTQEQHSKLVDKYGEAFTEKLIEELDNYKVATGKKYEEDYRAILNWVVEKCERKYPKLKKTPQQEESCESNPFENFK